MSQYSTNLPTRTIIPYFRSRAQSTWCRNCCEKAQRHQFVDNEITALLRNWYSPSAGFAEQEIYINQYGKKWLIPRRQHICMMRRRRSFTTPQSALFVYRACGWSPNAPNAQVSYMWYVRVVLDICNYTSQVCLSSPTTWWWPLMGAHIRTHIPTQRAHIRIHRHRHVH